MIGHLHADGGSESIKVSVITPTLGRSSLERAGRSIVHQLRDGDQWIVVGDGPQPAARKIVESFGDSRILYRESPGTKCWGNCERDLAMSLATGDRLLFLDDDDEFLPTTLAVARRAHVLDPLHPFIFRMTLLEHNSTLWAVPVLRSGNIGTPMICPLNDKAKLPIWQHHSRHGYGSDFSWIRACCSLQGTPVFAADVVCHVHHAPGPIHSHREKGYQIRRI
jgi:glycosyltransferase involved in cell wall biosynthesis